MRRRLLLALFMLAAGAVALFPPGRPLAIRQSPISHLRSPAVTRRFAVPVLMYHRVCDLTPQEARSPLLRDLTVSPADFEGQLRYLVENGFSVLLAREVERAVREGGELPERAVAVTLDDGYRDNFTHAFPVLRRYRLPATLFLVTGSVDTPRHLAWDEIQLMHGEGMGYGSHTVHHPDLTLLPLDRLDYELRESRRMLEDRLLERITAVAYPAGRYNRQVADRARAAGYLAGWKKGGGPAQPGEDMFLLPRVRVHGRTTMRDFQRKVWSGVYRTGAAGALAGRPSVRSRRRSS